MQVGKFGIVKLILELLPDSDFKRKPRQNWSRSQANENITKVEGATVYSRKNRYIPLICAEIKHLSSQFYPFRKCVIDHVINVK